MFLCSQMIFTSFFFCLFFNKLILELCSSQPDAEVIEEHLEKVRVPAGTSSVSDLTDHTAIFDNFYSRKRFCAKNVILIFLSFFIFLLLCD